MPDTPYFTVDEFRARYPEIVATAPAPPGGVIKTDDEVNTYRELAEQAFELSPDVGVAFVPRTVTGEKLRSPNGVDLLTRHRLVRTVTAATAGDTSTIDLTDLQIDGAWLSLPAGWPLSLGAVTVDYTHGYDEPPLRVKQAVMLLTREWLVKGPVTDRATQIPTEAGGAINLATPGLLGSSFGLPEVDQTARDYGLRSYVG